MRKIILSMMVTADGFFEGLEQDINWHIWDDEMSAYMMDFFDTVDTFIYGRKSYELMLQYWPEQNGPFAEIMNKTPKLVYSRKLQKATWNAEIVKEIDPDAIGRTKRQEGKDLALFAGADLASGFIKHGLIDEYRMIVNPVVLGEGVPLFKDVESMQLKLVHSQAFNCGNVLLCYQPAAT
ncbi:MAG: dihydrofolate reductase [Balneolaceae bacterium]|nr:dihydrofolate reductase [Balneolaceae bacterium]